MDRTPPGPGAPPLVPGATYPPGTLPPPVDGAARRRSSGGRWRLRNWRVRTKLAVALLVPLALALVLGGLRVASSAGAASDLAALERQVRVTQQESVLVHELQRERVLAARFVETGRNEDRTDLDTQYARVTEEIDALREFDASELTGPARDALAGVLRDLGGLATTRRAVDGGEGPPASADDVVARYGNLIAPLLLTDRSTFPPVDDAALLRRIDAVQALARAKERISAQHATLLVASLRTDGLSPTGAADLARSEAGADALLDEFRLLATPQELALYDETVTGDAVATRERTVGSAVQQGAAGSQLQVAPQDWDDAATENVNLLRQVETALLDQAGNASSALSDEARSDAIRDALIVAALLLLTLALLVVVARSLLRPLQVLRTTAFDVADRRLPEAISRMRGSSVPDLTVDPVAVTSREEVGQVARAFDAVHTTAVRLAAEQALLRTNVNDIFVNLSRRSQGLVERQLRLIDELENSEQDPEQLGNLFQLDHLATRMRRNNENLLVLAGGELRRGSARPVAVLDVLRAAVSEVEEYRRVVVERPPSVSVSGLVVNDLVHLVAELVDNATAFSPPDTKVVLASSLAPDRSLVVEIRDSGVGMPLQELDEVNARLADPPVVDVSVARRMGLFVVGRLAQRHGISVRIAPAPGGAGLVATVRVLPAQVSPDPGTLAVDRPPAEAPAAGATAADEWSGSDVRVPMQVSVVDDSAAGLFSPSAYPAGGSPPSGGPPPAPARSVEDEWVDLFGRDAGRDAETGQLPRVPAVEPPVPPRPGGDRPVPAAGPPPAPAPRPADLPAADAPPVERPDAPPVDRPEAPPAVRPAPPVVRPDGPLAPPDGRPQPARPRAGDELTVPMADAGTGADGPIFEEIASAWFRERHSVPVAWEPPDPDRADDGHVAAASGNGSGPPRVTPASPDGDGRTGPPAARPPVPPPASDRTGAHLVPDPGAGPPPLPQRSPGARPGADRPGADRPGTDRPGTDRPGTDRPGTDRPGTDRPAPDRASPERPPLPVRGLPQDRPAARARAAAAEQAGWESPADDGWQAAEAARRAVPDGVTAAGLPKRRPRQHLVPGAAGASRLGGAAPGRGPARSADTVRGRLSSYQRGLREGREASGPDGTSARGGRAEEEPE